MGKGMLRAALLCVGLLVAGVARADTVSTLVKSDTLALYGADSSAVLNVSNAARLWLDFASMPVYDAALGSGADTAIVLFVSVREVLSIAAGTDTSATAGTIKGQDRNRVPAAWSDSTVIPWVPKYVISANTVATLDTVLINGIASAQNIAGSSEFRVYIPVRSSGLMLPRNRTVRVDLVNPVNGVPFRAQFASFRWRLGTLTAAPSTTKAYARIRVVLGMETF